MTPVRGTGTIQFTFTPVFMDALRILWAVLTGKSVTLVSRPHCPVTITEESRDER